ncbi:MAG: hypothetical protein PHI06_11100 [Desulfobulbaceae bacterium]|nr:hypothetical protein [Desulfobulbaceae bacterium]
MTNDELCTGYQSDIEGLSSLLPTTAQRYHEVMRDQEALNSLVRWPLLLQSRATASQLLHDEAKYP